MKQNVLILLGRWAHVSSVNGGVVTASDVISSNPAYQPSNVNKPDPSVWHSSSGDQAKSLTFTFNSTVTISGLMMRPSPNISPRDIEFQYSFGGSYWITIYQGSFLKVR